LFQEASVNSSKAFVLTDQLWRYALSAFRLITRLTSIFVS